MNNLKELKKECENCRKCKLFETRNNVVFSDGSDSAKVIFIGEAPGKDEDEKGVPFVGRAGKFLTKMLEQIGIDRKKDIYISNTIKCRPPKNRVPLKSEKKACEQYLFQQIKIINPKLIVMIGSTAMNSFLETDEKITSIRGKILDLIIDNKEYKGIVIFHPSYLLRQHSEKVDAPRALTIMDLKLIKTFI